MSCPTHPQWLHDSNDCPLCDVSTEPRVVFLHCHSCGKCVSTGFTPVPTDTPDKGLILRAFVECPECIDKKYIITHLMPSKSMMIDSIDEEDKK